MSIEKGDPIPEAKLFDWMSKGRRMRSRRRRLRRETGGPLCCPRRIHPHLLRKHLPSFVQHAEAIKPRVSTRSCV